MVFGYVQRVTRRFRNGYRCNNYEFFNVHNRNLYSNLRNFRSYGVIFR